MRRATMNKFVTFIVLPLLIISAIYGLFVVQEFIGNAIQDSHEGKAGNIYELVIKYRVPVDTWAGVFGVAVRVEGLFNSFSEILEGGDLQELNLFYDCLEPDIAHEIYATTLSTSSAIDWGGMTSASPAEVDAFTGKDSSDLDSAVNTFTQSYTFDVGTNSITAPATFTYAQAESGEPQTFVVGILKDGNGEIIFAAETADFVEGFNGRSYNYQMLLPIPFNGSREYYFYTDPFDICPAGEGTEPPRSKVIGNVTDTSGNRINGTIVTVADSSNVSTTTGFYQVQPQAGVWDIFAVKEGYQVYQNNVTVTLNDTTIHDIVLVEVTDANPFTGFGDGDGVGPGVGPGEDAPGDQTQTGEGPGEIPPVPFTEQPVQIEGTDYIISLNDLKRKIRPDEFVQENIYLFSFRQEPVTVTFELEGNASQLIDFDKQSLTIDPNSNDQVTLTIFGRAPVGVYNGSLFIDGDINATIPVEIEIVSKDKLPVESLSIDIEAARQSVLPGDSLKFKTDLRNLLIEYPYAVDLLYTIQPLDGGPVIWTESASTYLQTAFSLIKTAQMPNDLAAGDYVLRVTANYLGLSSASSTLFTVDVPFWQRIYFGLRVWHWFLIIATILAIAGAGYWYYRKEQAKKKFHLKVDMKELPQPGPRSIPVGKIAETDHKTYFNLEQFKTHCIVAGSTGGGKSVSAQVVIEEALEKDVAVLAFDPTAQWTGMLRACKDKMMISLYPLFGMKKTDARAYPGNVRMLLDAREKINIPKYIKPGEIQVFCFHKLQPKDMDIVVSNAIKSIFDSGPDENKALKVMFVFDEVHRLLPKYGGNGSGFLQIERACREFRKWGMGVMLISQVLSDFEGTIKANINTEIQMRTRDEGDLERIRQKYGEDVLRSLVKATVGSGMVENPAYNRGQPYFVAFRPLKHSVERMTDEEIQKYNDYNEKMDDLFYSLEQLEALEVDVFDLKLELKLALDKVKAGNFNMVDVYLEGITPRIDKQWEKLGKKPKRFERELVDEAELQADIEKAKKDNADAKGAEASTAGASADEGKKEIGWKDDVAPDKMLNLTNGMIVISLSSLYDELSAMKEDDFKQHVVDAEKNDFAKWVMDAIGDTKLAYNLYATADQAKMLELLEMKRDEKELPDAKPPAWLGNAQGEQKAEAAKPEAAKPEEKPEEAQEKKPEEVPQSPEKKETSEQENKEQPVKPETPPEKTGSPEKAESSASPEQPASEPAQPAQASDSTQQSTQASDDMQQQAPAQPEQKPEAAQTRPEQASQTQAASQEESVPEQTAETQATAEPTPQASQEAPTSEENLEEKTNNYDNLIAKPDQAFKLENGKTIESVKALRDYIKEMPDDMFNNHVGADYNHFADWIQGVFQEEGLAQKMRSAHSKDEISSLLGG